MNNIDTFVSEKLQKGVEIKAIKKMLLTVGWKEDEVQLALSKALLSMGVPAPQSAEMRMGEKRAATVEVTVNFFSFILLGIVATALGVLYYGIINRYFPDALINGYSYNSGSASIHYAIAALLVAFPMYVFAVKIWFKRFREDAQKEESKLSKWLTYIVLLIAAVTIVGDLISVIFGFLQGELTMRFFLKALTILVIAGTVFGFYFLERKKIQYKKDIPRSAFNQIGYGMTVIVLLGIVLGFFAAGTPAVERQRSLDDQRAQSLRVLAQCVSQYTSDRAQLPVKLADLDESSMYSYCAGQRYDPETKEEFSYRALSAPAALPGVSGGKEAKFELCANFSSSYKPGDIKGGMDYYGMDDKWSYHEIGVSCDTETVLIREATPVIK